METSGLMGFVERAAREDFGAFVAKVFGEVCPGQDYLHNWHLDVVGDYLMACQRGDISRLIINMPPRALKSICVSVAWPAWLMGHDPTCKIMAASYVQSLANKHSVDCRLVMQSPWYLRMFPETVLSRDQNEKQKFVTTRRGMRMATSVWGTATGEGGNVLIVDDPMNPKHANAPRGRDYVNQWFDHTFSTRLDDKKRGVIVVVMQRLHEDDLSGYLLRKGGWEWLQLPAIATRDEQWDVRGGVRVRKAGELLHPAREDAGLIERAKRELGSQQFAAQYQQQPLTHEGAMVRLEWFGRF